MLERYISAEGLAPGGHNVRAFLRETTDYLSDKLQLNVRYFVGGSVWLFIPTLVSYLLGLMRSIAFARLTEQSVYGQYNFVLSIVGLFGVLTLPGISTALVETVARGNYGALIDATRARVRWGILATLATTLVALYYLLEQRETELGIAIILAGSFMPFAPALGMVQHYYSGRKRFDKTSQMSSVLLLLKTAVLLLLLWFQRGLIWLVIANSGLEILFYGAYYRHIVQHIRNAPRDSEVVAYGRSLTWSNAIITAAAQLDSTILGFSTGFVDVAIYKIATILPESIKDLMKMTGTLSMPKIAEQPDKKVYSKRTRRHLSYLLILNLVVVLVAIVALPIFVALLYGNQYTNSVRYAQALMLSLVVGWPSAFFVAALQARKQTRSIYRANVVYGVLQIGTLIAAVPIWGTWGIVLSRIISRWGLALYQWYAVRKI